MPKKSVDRRTLKTKKAIRQAFAELLQEKELHKITVQEIADKADISRFTFYKYYLDVYDLYEKIEREMLIQISIIILYFRWTGTHVISMISFSNMKIQSTSLLSPTIYSNIGGSTIYCSPAAVAGTAKILDISIPTNVSKVRAVVTSPMMCSLSDGWLSLTSINSTVTIN